MSRDLRAVVAARLGGVGYQSAHITNEEMDDQRAFVALDAIPNGWAKVDGRWVQVGPVVLDYWDAQWSDGSGFLPENTALFGVLTDNRPPPDNHH